MTRLLIVALLPFLLASGPGETPSQTPQPEAAAEWPQKGDTVFVSAKLVEQFGSLPLLTSAEHLTVEPCAPLMVKRGTDPTGPITVADDTGRPHRLMGDWSARLHRTADACATMVSAKGLPRVQAQWYRHRLVPTP